MPDPKIHLKEKTPSPNRSIRSKPKNPGNNPLETAAKIAEAPIRSSLKYVHSALKVQR